jgi:glyoxylase-like metal-dependent hydrolase (beta-lactamase superfamily II)
VSRLSRRCVEVPTPFEVGSVNAYLLGGVLIDPGPDTEKAREALVEGLESEGVGLEGIEAVVITHPHLDHFGLASYVVEESGASVFVHEDAVEAVVDHEAHYEEERDFFSGLLVEHGMPESTAEYVLRLPSAFLDLAPPVPHDSVVPVSDGDAFTDASLEAVETPGHCFGSVSPVRDDGVFTGDHLLDHITPNPTLQKPIDGERRRSVIEYLGSLERVADVGAERAFPGHGEPIDDVCGRAEEVIAHHEDRADEFEGLLEEPMTAYELMCEKWHELPATEQFFGMSETLGHLELLEERDRVVRHEEGVVRYERTRDGG